MSSFIWLIYFLFKHWKDSPEESLTKLNVADTDKFSNSISCLLATWSPVWTLHHSVIWCLFLWVAQKSWMTSKSNAGSCFCWASPSCTLFPLLFGMFKLFFFIIIQNSWVNCIETVLRNVSCFTCLFFLSVRFLWDYERIIKLTFWFPGC